MTRSRNAKIKVPVLLGATGVGKSELAFRLAHELDLEIISCDSRQIYRGMDIGTAKPSQEQLAHIRHWLVDIIEPSELFSAYQFSAAAATILRSLFSRGGHGLICGGTGFYYKCLSEGIAPQAPSNTMFRKKYEKKVLKEGINSILKELRAVDPKAADSIHPKDIRRIIRALEISYKTGFPVSELKKYSRPPNDFEFCVTIADLPRSTLYRRIDARVNRMVAAGLWDEFRALRERGYDEGSPGLLCVGYRELFDVERRRMGFKEACEKIKSNTRRYAKRQITWFKHQTKGTVENLSSDRYGIVEARFREFLHRDQNKTIHTVP